VKPTYSQLEWHFREIKWAVCPVCLERVPAPDLDYTSKKCRACHQKECDAWQMDSEKSYASLTITPIETQDGSYYEYSERLEVRPYPNPLGHGGMSGGGRAKDEAGLEKVIASFHAEVERWKKHGLTNIKVEREEKRVLASQVIIKETKREKAKEVLTRKEPAQATLF